MLSRLIAKRKKLFGLQVLVDLHQQTAQEQAFFECEFGEILLLDLLPGALER
jgi:hypothetical protein